MIKKSLMNISYPGCVYKATYESQSWSLFHILNVSKIYIDM